MIKDKKLWLLSKIKNIHRQIEFPVSFKIKKYRILLVKFSICIVSLYLPLLPVIPYKKTAPAQVLNLYEMYMHIAETNEIVPVSILR